MNEINQYKVKELPNSAYYIPHFLTEEEEADLIHKVYSAPKPKWKDLLNRRLQNWGGIPHQKAMIQEDLPEWLQKCARKVSKLGVFGTNIPNHVLVNEYMPGQGIMPHEDGPVFYPTIATINLGSHTTLNYYKKTADMDFSHTMALASSSSIDRDNHYVGSLLLEKCSLLIVQDDLYDKYLHGIEEVPMDEVNDSMKNLDLCDTNIGHVLIRERRISLTIRYVPKVIKANKFYKLK